MSETTLDLFRHVTEFNSFTQGQTIFQEGDPSGVMYVVIDGEVDIIIHGKVLSPLGPGGILGEMALIDEQARSATAVAKTDCWLAPINKKSFHFLVKQTPNVALLVMKIMAGRLRQGCSRLGNYDTARGDYERDFSQTEDTSS